MIKRLGILLIAVMTPLSTVTAGSVEEIREALRSSSRPLVLFGDSTTAPRGKVKIYGELLEETLREKELAIPVINAGVPGNTTRFAKARFESDVVARHPAIVLIQFGINDSAVDVWKDPPATEPRVSLQEYRENIEFFIDAIHALGGHVVLMTPNRVQWSPILRERYNKPPYDTEREDGFNTAFLDDYAEAVREIAETRKVPLIDVHAAYRERSGEEVKTLLLSDGMHPGNEGHALVHRLLISGLFAE